MKSDPTSTRTAVGDPADRIARERPAWLKPVLLGLAAVCLLGLFSGEIGDSDFWWHLKTGQYIGATKSLPVPDPFAYSTYEGKPSYPGEERTRFFNLTHEWLAQLGIYAVYSVAGAPGVILTRAFLLVAFCAIVGYLAARRVGNFYWGLAAAFSAASIARMFAADRPALVTFLMVACFVAILETGRGLWLLPLLSIVWANCHGGFFLGWVVLGAYTLEVLTRRRTSRYLPWIAIGSVLLSGLNPNHFGVIRTLADYRSSYLTSTLIEWKPPYWWGPPYAFDILLYAAVLVLVLARKSVRLVDWLLFAAFTAASLAAFRNIMLTALLAPILIAGYFPWKFKMPAVSGIVAAILISCGLAAGIAQRAFFQLRAAEWRFPSGACDFLLSHGNTGRLFNTYEYGGYLIWRLWPETQVFVDGRALNEQVYRDYRSILYNLGSPPAQMGEARLTLLEHYGIETMVVNSFEYVTGAVYPIALALGNPETADWKLVYEDTQSLVFRRNPPGGMPEISKARRVIDHMEAECATHIEHQPELPLCARTLADLSLRAGDRERARRMLGIYLAHQSERDPSAEQTYRSLVTQQR